MKPKVLQTFEDAVALREFEQASKLRRIAKVFPNQEALKEYKRQHPNMDMSYHSVAPPKKNNKNPEEKPKEESEETAKGEFSWPPEFVKGLTDYGKKVVSFFKKAPENIQKFCADPDARKEMLSTAKETLKKLPHTVVDRARRGIKDEVKAYGTAVKGVKAALKGEKLTEAHKEAIKEVALDAVATIGAIALTGGLAGGLSTLASATANSYAVCTARKLALNVMSEGLGHYVAANTMTEFLQAIVQRVVIAEKGTKKEPDDKDVMLAYLTALLYEELGKLTKDEVLEALKDAAEGKGDKQASELNLQNSFNALQEFKAAVALQKTNFPI